jgi:hypothetical protein
MCFQVFRNNSDGTTEGSLFQIMNNTCTSFGSRLLRNWVRLSSIYAFKKMFAWCIIQLTPTKCENIAKYEM